MSDEASCPVNAQTIGSEPPSGSTFEIHSDGTAVNYSWKQVSRHPLQWIPLSFGCFMIFGAVVMPMVPTHLFRRKRTFDADALGSLTLERVGERQRLRVDCGADRIEIGALLREPEREWLAVQLQEWLRLRDTCDG